VPSVTAPFESHLDQHSAWRRELSLRLKLLGEWLAEQQLDNPARMERLRRLEAQTRSDRVRVAFVAEFSRGKSELINAIFFAHYGRRIMPASPGRTTMCPTELYYEPGTPPCLRLLSVHTRRESATLADWRRDMVAWEKHDLKPQDPVQMAQVLHKVTEVEAVSVDDARALGFWDDTHLEANPTPLPDGRVEIPRWRHALITLTHPLLKQGLVILDTPGLNAVGVEPELTLNLIGQADAVVFILAADAGVTRSDLAIWRAHIAHDAQGAVDAATRLVVLNKIDTLWSGVDSAQTVSDQLERQVAECARVLDIAPERVMAVSAQKGLVAKIDRNAQVLAASRLPALEAALGEGLLAARQRILRSAVSRGMGELRADVSAALHGQRRELSEQLVELRGLRGKNSQVVNAMRGRIQREWAEFEPCEPRIQALRAIYIKELKELYRRLGKSALESEMRELLVALAQQGLKLGLKRVYGDAFERLRLRLAQVEQGCNELHAMLAASYRQLNTEFGFSLQPPDGPALGAALRDLAAVEAAHLKYLGLGHTLRLAQSDFARRLVNTLQDRVRHVYDSAQAELDIWSKGTLAQLDAHYQDRRNGFERRLQAIERIRDATTGLDERLAALEADDAALTALEQRLNELTRRMTDEPAERAAA
jgi:hypothetical protein